MFDSSTLLISLGPCAVCQARLSLVCFVLRRACRPAASAAAPPPAGHPGVLQVQGLMAILQRAWLCL